MGTRPLTDAEMDELTFIKAEAEEDARWNALHKEARILFASQRSRPRQIVLLRVSRGTDADGFDPGPHRTSYRSPLHMRERMLATLRMSKMGFRLFNHL